MNIISLVLSLSLTITLALKGARVFIDLDKAIVNRSEKFKSETISLLHSKKGQISLVALLWLIILTALLNFFTFKNTLIINEAKNRKEHYLCMRSLNIETINYIKRMNQFNITLRALFLSYSTGANSLQTKLMIEATKKIRDGFHLLYLKNITFNQYCPHKQMVWSYHKNFPYQLTGVNQLITQLDGTTILRSKKWSYFIHTPKKMTRFQKNLCLKSSIMVSNSFDLSVEILEEEIKVQDFQFWKCSFG